MKWEDQLLATGTGFLAQRNGVTFLITNRHNLDGLNNEGKPRHARGVTPTSVSIFHNSIAGVGNWIEIEESVVDSNEHPLWLTHPILGPRVDAAALKLTNLDGAAIYAHDLRSQISVDVSVAQDVSIVGFPFGMTGGGRFGIWSRGTIATEPEVDYENLPLFLVDSRTRKGQSGSPVIFYSSTGTASVKGGLRLGGGPIEQLLGIYSGRVNEQSDLGFVWKTSAIRAIVDQSS